MPLDVYLLQVPILLVLMFLFWNTVSILFSQLSAMSKDVKNLMSAMSTPFFWLSGVLFDVKDIHIGWVQTMLDFNPITFFVTAFRGAFYDKTWILERSVSLRGLRCRVRDHPPGSAVRVQEVQ